MGLLVLLGMLTLLRLLAFSGLRTPLGLVPTLSRFALGLPVFLRRLLLGTLLRGMVLSILLALLRLLELLVSLLRLLRLLLSALL